MIRYLSLFSGIGGFEYGIQQSQYGNDAICVAWSEIDKYADSIYRRRFPSQTIKGTRTHIPFGDVTKIKTTDLPDFELLVAGFPCQSFSIAGFQGGFDDCRGTLFFEIARILKDCRPKYFLLENVRNLLGHNQGKTFQRILEVLSDLGYYVEWQVLNSKEFVPQNRERIFIKGYSRAECGEEILLSKRINPKVSPQRNEKKEEKLNGYEEYLIRNTARNHQDGRIYSDKKQSISLNHSQNNGFYIMSDDTPNDIKNIYASTQRDGKRKETDYSPCINASAGMGGGHIPMVEFEDFNIRRLTPVECERLQGFPDDWTKYGVNGEIISDNQRYKTLGNAVTTKVITHIFNNWDLNV
jgi:DNA (cytosine-5)-methyltransferase 1